MEPSKIDSKALSNAIDRLCEQLLRYPQLAVAVSGGVDSMTLAAIAHDVLGDRLMLVHALSPAVPAEASARVQNYAAVHGWVLKVVEAGEFADEQYLSNPVNRCYFCKTNLYARLQEVWAGPIASGANLDDLGDYRPGLLAASENKVVHPLIDARIDKSMVRAIAAHKQLDEIAELPAQPCLSSRVETGIAIDANDLLFVHHIEKFLTQALGPGDIRCRITASGVRVEVPDELQLKNKANWQQIYRELKQHVQIQGRVLVGVSDYNRGSAFLHPAGKE